MPQQLPDFYRRPAALTSGGQYADLFDNLPCDVASLARIVQGLTIHEYMAGAYGVTVPEARRSESHLRLLEQMLERLLAQDNASLSTTRPPEKRLVGVCRHFMLLIVALLRARGIAARARVGFGTYFNAGTYEDHWLCEYWNETQTRWIRVDAQLDAVQQKALGIDFDPFDVPRDRFLSAGEAWAQCRSGQADPATFGIFIGHLRGLWFIAGDLVRDVAALNAMEMLAWDVWGAMPAPNATLSEAELAFFDHLAALTQNPDTNFVELRDLYLHDIRLHVPPTVFNAVLNCSQTI